MKLLFDFISIQGFINGGAEHAKRIFNEITNHYPNIEILGLYNSKINFLADDFNKYSSQISSWVDINKISSLGEYINNNNINVFYIGIFQRYLHENLDNINCKTVVFIHDVSDLELYNNKLNYISLSKATSFKSLCKNIAKFILYQLGMRNSYFYNCYSLYAQHSNFLNKDNVIIACASFFTKDSIKFNMPFLNQKEINVRYSPLKLSPHPSENLIIKELVQKNIPYFLMLSTDRWTKNSDFAFDVIKAFCEQHKEYRLITTGSKIQKFANHIPLPFIDPTELEYAFKHAKALIYPSIVEGFGYPIIEAMKYGVPVICSNTTSIPEIAGNAGIYFNPFYRSDMYSALNKFINNNWSTMHDLSLNQYQKISYKQSMDLSLLIQDIVE